MNLNSRISKLEKHLKSVGIDAQKGRLLEPIKEGNFLWALDPDRDWRVFFEEHKGEKLYDLYNLVLGEMAQELWADYENDLASS